MAAGLGASGERLTFTLFLSSAVHALIVFGVNFTLEPPGELAPTLEITLASHASDQAPEQADYLAQSNQEASGRSDQARELTTDRLAEFADTQVREVTPPPQPQASREHTEASAARLATTSERRQQVTQQPDPEPDNPRAEQVGQPDPPPPVNPEIASLKAKLDRQRAELAKRPRIRTLTSVAAKAAVEAAYLHEWREKVEWIGNLNYPAEARRRQIYGDLRLLVALQPDGTIHDVDILQSSGSRVLDDAALQIVHLAAPFAEFPPELKRKWDRLEIIRTWRFEPGGLTSQ